MAQAQHHAGVDVLPGGEPFVQHPHGAVHVGNQQQVDDEPGPVLGQDGGLAYSADNLGDFIDCFRRGRWSTDDLDEFCELSWIEEMHANRSVSLGDFLGDLV